MNNTLKFFLGNLLTDNDLDGLSSEESTTPRSCATIACAIEKDFSDMLEEMKGLENMARGIGTIDDIGSLTPGQLYDETYRRILEGTIKKLKQKLEEFK